MRIPPFRPPNALNAKRSQTTGKRQERNQVHSPAMSTTPAKNSRPPGQWGLHRMRNTRIHPDTPLQEKTSQNRLSGWLSTPLSRSTVHRNFMTGKRGTGCIPRFLTALRTMWIMMSRWKHLHSCSITGAMCPKN